MAFPEITGFVPLRRDKIKGGCPCTEGQKRTDSCPGPDSELLETLEVLCSGTGPGIAAASGIGEF